MSKIIIQGTHLELTEEIKNYIYEKFNKLDRYFDNILEIRVEVERALPGHHNKGKVYRAEANVHVPKKILRVEKTAEDLFKAIDKTEKHMREIIKEHKGKIMEK
ncbi:MAG: ribosome-associated translation inhibitor RaiA [bacterium]